MTDNIASIGFLIDLDGTIYAGDKLIDGAKEAILYLQQHRYPFVFVSNRGNYSRQTCHQKLKRFGIEVDEEQIVLTSTVAAHYLSTNYKHEAIWVLGNEELKIELKRHHLLLASTPQDAKWLVITLHEQVTYDELNQAFRAVQAGARIIATNADKTFPRDDGNCIDVAAMIGAIAYSTGKEPDIVVGKPHIHIVNYALKQLKREAHHCIVIGDSMNSDIVLAKNFNMKSAFVLSGATTLAQYEQHPLKADYVAKNIFSFIQSYFSSTP